MPELRVAKTGALNKQRQQFQLGERSNWGEEEGYKQNCNSNHVEKSFSRFKYILRLFSLSELI